VDEARRSVEPGGAAARGRDPWRRFVIVFAAYLALLIGH
jgi:hypothetical protein